MNKFYILQTLFSIISIAQCQQNPQDASHDSNKRQDSYPQYYPVHNHFSLKQHHPTAQPTTATITQQYPHHSFFHSTTASSYVDLDRFNQQAKAIKDQVNYINHYEQKNLKHHVNSVHQGGSEPHFDFMVNSNYSDLEKASEQFVHLGSLAAKQNLPKVIKITKTVAVKQPVPVPYPVPVVKYIKEQVPVEYAHTAYGTASESAPVTEKPSDFKPSPYYSNYTSYINKYPENTSAYKIAESYIKKELMSTVSSVGPGVEYDTRPFYVQTEQEMIKYIPVPYYIDEEGNRHEIKTSQESTSSSASAQPQQHQHHHHHQQQQHESESYYSKHVPSSTVASTYENPGKFHSYTFSYHPPTLTTTTPTPSYQHHQYASVAQPLHATPESNKYYFSHTAADNSISPSSASHYVYNEQVAAADAEQSMSTDDEHQHYQYKYVYERRR